MENSECEDSENSSANDRFGIELEKYLDQEVYYSYEAKEQVSESHIVPFIYMVSAKSLQTKRAKRTKCTRRNRRK